MKPAEDIEKLIKNIDIDTNAKMDKAVLNNTFEAFEKSKTIKSAERQPNIWRIIMKNRTTRLAAAIVVILAACWLAVSDRGEELKEQETNGPVVIAKSKTPAELVSAVSLSMVFRDGGIEAMEKQFDKAEKKVRPGLKERITIDQLICELEECEEI
jgi:hypothetical protein